MDRLMRCSATGSEAISTTSGIWISSPILGGGSPRTTGPSSSIVEVRARRDSVPRAVLPTWEEWAIREATESLGLRLRTGLHTGECEVRGDDLGGLAVHIAARVGAKASAGEVLVSSTVKDLVIGSGIDFADRGEHELKGVPGAWRLFAVRADSAR